MQLGAIRCKQIIRWQHLSRIKARLLWLAENAISPIKTHQAASGTSAATYKLMEPHWQINYTKKFMPMVGFEPGIFDDGDDCSTNNAATTAPSLSHSLGQKGWVGLGRVKLHWYCLLFWSHALEF